MTNRIYNKIYVNRNRDDVTENLVLGYQHDQKEIIFKKDQETYFHIPTYTNSILLADTNLIANGACAGGYPAASDRILKSKKNYGNTTHHGTPTEIADGMWFCSWLYKDPETGTVQWMDRYYNPGKFDYTVAKSQLLEYPPFVQLDPIYKDVPSKMLFEPGVLYRYFHFGEKSFENLLTTFEGASSEHLMLHLSGWGTETVDRSANKLVPFVNTTLLAENLYEQPKETERLFNPVIRFDNTSNVDCYVNYDSSYNPINEFTWSMWGYSKNWQDSPSTQLIGNYTEQGGVGIFLDTLETYPFILIPETTYGHAIFLNQNGDGYLDKTLQKNFSPVKPVCFAIDSNDNVLVCNEDTAGVMYKMDHYGKIVRSTKNLADLDTLFAFSLSGEQPKQALCGKDDDFYVITNKAAYKFDNNLKLKQSIPQSIDSHTIAAFSYNSATDTEELVLVNGANDVKFVETTKWWLKAEDGNLYKDSNLFQTLEGKGTRLSIDPNGKIWVLHGNNKISIINPDSQPQKSIERALFVGTDEDRTSVKKNITFIKRYNRTTETKQWFALIYYTDENLLYFYTLEGLLDSTTDLSLLFDSNIVSRYNQDPNNFTFLSEGDLTGYERRRVFNKLSPYNNNRQIVLKASVRDTSKDSLFFRTFKASSSIESWILNSWQHILLTYRNKKFQLWVNNVPLFELKIEGQYELSYETQPSFYIGSPTGNSLGLNNELKTTTSIFNGKIGDIRMYDYAMSKINIETFLRASTLSNDIYWSMPIPLTQYVEVLERTFKHKLPGAKSQFFNLKLKGTNITDSTTRELIEAELREIVEETKLAYTDLLKIEWM
jgi:hypothetical protein